MVTKTSETVELMLSVKCSVSGLIPGMKIMNLLLRNLIN
jgi:hypothetical protein